MKWISVDEKLPPNFTDVLVRNASNFQHVAHYNAPNFLYKEGRSIVATGHRTVTHWMKLPKGPDLD